MFSTEIIRNIGLADTTPWVGRSETGLDGVRRVGTMLDRVGLGWTGLEGVGRGGTGWDSRTRVRLE